MTGLPSTTTRWATLAPEPDVDMPALLPSALRSWQSTGDGTRPRRSLRDWIVDVLAFLLALTIGGLFLATVQDATPVGPVWVVLDVVLGLACSTALWWRRRWPVAIALAVTAASIPSVSAQVAALVMLFTVAVHRRARVALGVALAGMVAAVPYSLLRERDLAELWHGLVMGLLVTALVLGWGMFARARRQVIVSLRDRAARAEAEQQLRSDQARRTERARIAREMHDVLAHRISLLAVHAGALEFRADASREQVAAAAGVIRANAHQALEELREVIGVLREEDGDASRPEPPQPGLAEVPALVEESRQAGARIDYRCDVGTPDTVPASIARTAYRVVQEGLTNARKHAPGLPIDVRLAGAPDGGLQVAVENPLPSWPPEIAVPGAGLGLVGLAERVGLAGGRLRHGPDGDRFTLRVELPWER